MKLALNKGTTSKLVTVFVLDSSVTTGVGKTGLAYDAAGLEICYHRSNASAPVCPSLADMTLGTWVSGGFKEIDATTMPGFYQFGIPDAALADGADSVVIMVRGAAGMLPVVMEIQLLDHEPIS